jgi:signal transduction histidine kinase
MVEELGWKSSLATPLLFEDRAIGILEVYSHGGERNFTSWHRRLFRTLAFQIASAIEGWSNRRRLDELNKILRQMTEARNRAELLESALEGALRLAGSGRGWISLLDLGSGRLDIAVQKGAPRSLPSLTLGKGISGKALQDNHTIRTSDVVNGEFRNLYQEFCKDTRSELAVPIVSADIEIRLGRGTSLGPKPIGVLNVESPTAGAFSKGDEDCVESIAREAAIIMDRLEFEHKYSAVSRIESEIVRRPDWPGVLETLSKGILTALGFTYVNISIVVPETNFIRTEYVIGIPGAEVQEFKAMANHSLDSQDIQADIVRSRHVEVLDKQDSRCDPLIYQRFGHDRLIRVFVPMIGPSDDRVIGTVEAGYEKGYRKYIYERDVQILKGLVDYAASVLEQRKGALFDKMMHEFRAPIAGIRHDASFLKRRIKELSDDLVERKFDDILTNTWLVLNEIAELEYRLSGQVSPASKVERTLVVRDIIIKTVNEMRPVVHAHGLDASKIHYRNEDIGKILIYVNRAKLNQVVSNILMNSIKYAEKEPQKFAIRISVDETAEHFFIKFKDWGIGIRQDLVERVFEKGFRGPEAQARFVTGSGLGLPIARETMREIGGDLRLVANYKPCEFDIVLPRTLKRGGE